MTNEEALRALLGFLSLLTILIAIIVFAVKRKKSKNYDYLLTYYKSQSNQNSDSEKIETVNKETNEPIVIETINKIPFQRKYLLTKNELYFYKELKKVADKYNLAVLSKIRLADLIEVKKSEISSKSEWFSFFGKIKAKHIDFALANPENLYVLMLIEVDDSSHNKSNRIERDEFVQAVCNKVNIPLLRVNGPFALEEKIVEILSLESQKEEKKL